MSAIHDLLELARQIEQLRTVPPAPLHLHLRPRDGPARCPESKPAPERITGPHSAPQRTSSWDWRSKGVGS